MPAVTVLDEFTGLVGVFWVGDFFIFHFFLGVHVGFFGFSCCGLVFWVFLGEGGRHAGKSKISGISYSKVRSVMLFLLMPFLLMKTGTFKY